MNQYTTIKEVAAELGVHRTTVSKWIEAKVLPVHKLGRRCVRIDKQDVATLLKKYRTILFLVLGMLATDVQQTPAVPTHKSFVMSLSPVQIRQAALLLYSLSRRVFSGLARLFESIVIQPEVV